MNDGGVGARNSARSPRCGELSPNDPTSCYSFVDEAGPYYQVLRTLAVGEAILQWCWARKSRVEMELRVEQIPGCG